MKLVEPPPPSATALAAARQAILAETALPRISWRTGALRLLAASTGLAVAILMVLLVLGAAEGPTLVARWMTLLLMGATGPVLVWGAAQPGGRAVRAAGYVLAAVGALALVATRPAHVSDTSITPEWLCTATHLLIAGPALVASVWLLRNMAASWPRTLTAGLASGTTGALLGEVMCGRDAWHVATFHLASWLLAAAAVGALSLKASRRTFAP